MSSLKSFCITTYFLGIRNTVQEIPSPCPIDVIEHWHEDNYSSKLVLDLFVEFPDLF